MKMSEENRIKLGRNRQINLEVVDSNGKMTVPSKPVIEERHLICAAPDGTKANMDVMVIARWYMSARSDAQMIYCCIWVYGKDNTKVGYRSGSGNAGGYGYCKRSAAFAEAFHNAGFKTEFDCISGRGMSNVDVAIESIGELLGYDIDNMILVGG